MVCRDGAFGRKIQGRDMALEDVCRSPQRAILLVAQPNGEHALDSLPADDGGNRQAHLPKVHRLWDHGRHREHSVFVAQDGRCDSSQRGTDTVVGGSLGPQDVPPSPTGAVGDSS